jgi:cyclic pyranopterin phosphate synthase
LYAQTGTDLRDALRDGRSDADFIQTLHSLWEKRDDRGAEKRLAEKDRGPAVSLDDLLADPLLEMHTRGG